MARLCIPLLLITLMTYAMAQDSSQVPADEQEAAVASEAADTAAESAEDAEPEFIDDPDLDEQTYEEDEDVFIPSQEIPSDEPIPFPTDI